MQSLLIFLAFCVILLGGVPIGLFTLLFLYAGRVLFYLVAMSLAAAR